jgi:hypothetical protein
MASLNESSSFPLQLCKKGLHLRPVEDKYCKECRKEYQKNYQKNYIEKNKQKLKQAQRDYYEKNKEEIKQQSKNYREKHREKYIQYQKEHYLNNKEEYQNYYKKYSLKNKKILLANSAKYKAQKIKATPSWANSKLIQNIYKNCPKGFHVDHIYPLRSTVMCGLHVENNLQYLKAETNISKKNNISLEQQLFEEEPANWTYLIEESDYDPDLI